MHLLMAANALTIYLDHEKCVDFYVDVSDCQIDACITQEWMPVLFCEKLSKSQDNHIVMERICFPLLQLLMNCIVCF